MRMVKLGNSNLRVSRICVGTVFRAESGETDCLATLRRAMERGCNFFDSANVYRDGFSEQVLGQAVAGRRDQFIVATKVGANDGGLTRAAILREVEASLGRLKTDYIDLYYCHVPDPQTPIEETLRALDDLVCAGKVRYIGSSNFEPPQLAEALAVSHREKLAAFTCQQSLYNLADRRIESDLIPLARKNGLEIVGFAPLMIGLLSGQFRHGAAPPEGTPWHKGPYNFRAAMSRRVDRIVETLLGIGRGHGKTAAQVAIAWCLARPGVAAVIAGADTPQQVDENADADGLILSDAERERLDVVSQGMALVVQKDCPSGYVPDAKEVEA